MKKREAVLLCFGIAGITAFFLPYFVIGGFGVSGLQMIQVVLFPENEFGTPGLMSRYSELANGDPGALTVTTIFLISFLLQPVFGMLVGMKFIFHATKPRSRKYLFEFVMAIILISINGLLFLLIMIGLSLDGASEYGISFLPGLGFIFSGLVLLLPKIIMNRMNRIEDING